MGASLRRAAAPRVSRGGAFCGCPFRSAQSSSGAAAADVRPSSPASSSLGTSSSLAAEAPSSSSSSSSSDKNSLESSPNWGPLKKELDALPVFCVADKEGNSTEAEPVWVKTSGYSPER